MKIKDMTKKTEVQLQDFVKDQLKELAELNRSKFIKEEKNVRKARNIRKDIARAKTILRQKTLGDDNE